MDKAQKDYAHLHALSREARTLVGIHSLLDWDHETYMPLGAVAIRSEQRKILAGIIHAKMTGKPFATALAKLIDIKTGTILAQELSSAQQAAMRQWRRDYIHEKALPKKFVEALAKLTSQAPQVWRQAREQNAFHQFAPFLEQIIKMQQKKAELLGYEEHPYDALLDLYEPGATTAEITTLFKQLRIALVPLIKKVTESQQQDDSFLFGNFPKEQQLKFSHVLLNALHYDLSKGRLDLSAHPFSSASHPTDSRITTHIHPTSLMSNIMAVLHETGHALYEMGLPVEHYGSPLGDHLSLGMHESQSRWWETLIGHSKPFWNHFLPLLKEHFNPLDPIQLDTFYRAINKVKPGCIRIQADELTYSLHVVLRFEIERGLIEKSLSVRDIPEVWKSQMKELLDIVPSTNSEGCLQDIHWSLGCFGYFPTYTLGNLYASQLFQAFATEYPKWQERVAKGELLFIKEWLAKAVYQHGHRYSSKELLHQVTGKAFSPDAFIHYLNQKYTNI